MQIVVQYKCPVTGNLRINALKDVVIENDHVLGDCYGIVQRIAVPLIDMAYDLGTDRFIDIRDMIASGAVPSAG